MGGPGGSTGDALAAVLAALCREEDHRRCDPAWCDHAATWWPRVLEVAGPALEARDRAWAVVCLVPACVVDGRPRLLLCTDSLTAATSARNSHYGRNGHNGYDTRGMRSVHGWMALVSRNAEGLRIR